MLDREKLPKEIARQMDAWRAGSAPLPQSYVRWNRKKAEARLEALCEDHRLQVHSTEMIDDGWFDGMQVLRAIIETTRGQLLSLKWNDSNQDFMRRCESGGHAALHDQDLTA